MWVKFFAQSAVLSHPISSGIPVFSDFFVQNIRAKKRSVTSGDSSLGEGASGEEENFPVLPKPKGFDGRSSLLISSRTGSKI